MATPMTAELKRGARVRFIGIVHWHIPFGAEGVVTGQDRAQWIVSFTVRGALLTVKLWRSEMEVLG